MRSCTAAADSHRERVLLNPGPAVVSDRIHRAVAGPDLCHREPEYSEMFARIREKLFRVAGVSRDWELALIAGSGTAAMEAMVGASVREGRRLLVCRNGVYGDRLATIAERLGIETVAVRAAQTEPIDPAAVAAALDADPTIDAVAVVHHETTTGLLNPVHEIADAGPRPRTYASPWTPSAPSGRRTCGWPGPASTWWRAPPTSASTVCPEPPSCSCPPPVRPAPPRRRGARSTWT